MYIPSKRSAIPKWAIPGHTDSQSHSLSLDFPQLSLKVSSKRTQVSEKLRLVFTKAPVAFVTGLGAELACDSRLLWLDAQSGKATHPRKKHTHTHTPRGLFPHATAFNMGCQLQLSSLGIRRTVLDPGCYRTCNAQLPASSSRNGACEEMTCDVGSVRAQRQSSPNTQMQRKQCKSHQPKQGLAWD